MKTPRVHRTARRRICGERNHKRFNCEPLASSAQSRRQWSQQVQRLSALLGHAPAGLDCRSLQRGQRGILKPRERAGVCIVTRTAVSGDHNQPLRRRSDFYPPLALIALAGGASPAEAVRVAGS